MAGVHDFTPKYDGKGYVFTVFVNSPEEAREIGARLAKAARGQVKAACMVGYTALTPEETRERLDALAKIASTGAGVEVDLNLAPDAMIEKGRHVFSLGRHRDCCERCLVILKDAPGGVGGPCDGEPLDDRACRLVTFAEGRGYYEGIRDSQRVLEEYRAKLPGTPQAGIIYRLMQRIGDLLLGRPVA